MTRKEMAQELLDKVFPGMPVNDREQYLMMKLGIFPFAANPSSKAIKWICEDIIKEEDLI